MVTTSNSTLTIGNEAPGTNPKIFWYYPSEDRYVSTINICKSVPLFSCIPAYVAHVTTKVYN